MGKFTLELDGHGLATLRWGAEVDRDHDEHPRWLLAVLIGTAIVGSVGIPILHILHQGIEFF